MTREQAQVIALSAMELSGKPVEQLWAELRRSQGHRPSRRPMRVTWSDVWDWATLLVLDAAEAQARARAPRWLVVVLERRLAHG